ncbi:hypothetical protein ACFS6H_18815 [Terrimonas rubra]|uniref:G domain-containing protein n=1 Tax=Terrimonas rubra TaxID=1035890 RepID=A0ABW6A8R4_9BACT
MISILLVGASNAGKSSTIQNVCKKLNPQKVFQLWPDPKNHTNSKIEPSSTDAIFNNTFIIEVAGKLILVCAGAPTEQNIRITILIEICITLKIDIFFALVAMRSFEKREGFDTPAELRLKSNIILEERIHRIQGDNFMETPEWNTRINGIVKLIEESL